MTVTEDSASTLAGVSASSLDLTSSGAITQTGAVGVTTTATFDAGGTTVGRRTTSRWTTRRTRSIPSSSRRAAMSRWRTRTA
ncbi:MAG: hypothetical protein U5O39_18995 [Gammaproteobacteria bacterium]|nr:hypothetical protein [Gammaproteobacteria bacterium]